MADPLVIDTKYMIDLEGLKTFYDETKGQRGSGHIVVNTMQELQDLTPSDIEYIDTVVLNYN